MTCFCACEMNRDLFEICLHPLRRTKAVCVVCSGNCIEFSINTRINSLSLCWKRWIQTSMLWMYGISHRSNYVFQNSIRNVAAQNFIRMWRDGDKLLDKMHATEFVEQTNSKSHQHFMHMVRMWTLQNAKWDCHLNDITWKIDALACVNWLTFQWVFGQYLK